MTIKCQDIVSLAQYSIQLVVFKIKKLVNNNWLLKKYSYCKSVNLCGSRVWQVSRAPEYLENEVAFRWPLSIKNSTRFVLSGKKTAWKTNNAMAPCHHCNMTIFRCSSLKEPNLSHLTRWHYSYWADRFYWNSPR